MDDLLDGRIPSQAQISHISCPDIQPTSWDNRKFHCAGIDIDDLNAFLPATCVIDRNETSHE
jgi:hypothetical protein